MNLTFDIIIILMVFYIFYDFHKGFLLLLCSKIALPSVIRLDLISISLSCSDIFSAALFISLLIHYNNVKSDIPQWLLTFIIFDVFTTFLFAFLSSQVVPLSYQITNIAKYKFTSEIPLFLMAYIAARKIHIKELAIWLIIICVCCGLYGILTYIIKTNPYIYIVSSLYKGEGLSTLQFMQETRGVLSGRVMGTMTHPLAWGLCWSILLSFITLLSNNINKYIYYLFMIVGIVNIFLCGSRAAFLGFFVFVLFYSFYKGFSIIVKRCLVLFFCSFFILPFVIPKEYNQYLTSFFYFWDDEMSSKTNIIGSSYQMRNSQLDESIRIACNSEVGGLGYGYINYSKEHGLQNNTMLGYESVIFMKIFEQGIGGLLSFLTLFILLFLRVIKYKKVLGRIIFLLYGYFFSFLLMIVGTGIQGESYMLFMLLFISFISINDERVKNKYVYLITRLKHANTHYGS